MTGNGFGQTRFLAALTVGGTRIWHNTAFACRNCWKEKSRISYGANGHVSVAAFLRAAAQNELKRRSGGVSDAERNVAATLTLQRRELKTIKTALNVHFALLDAFIRVMLYCVPEPSDEIHEAAKAQARARHEKLLRMAATIMKGEGNAAMTELAMKKNCGESETEKDSRNKRVCDLDARATAGRNVTQGRVM